MKDTAMAFFEFSKHTIGNKVIKERTRGMHTYFQRRIICREQRGGSERGLGRKHYFFPRKQDLTQND